MYFIYASPGIKNIYSIGNGNYKGIILSRIIDMNFCTQVNNGYEGITKVY